MAIKETLTTYTFTDGMNKIRPENFSYAGLGALYDYLNDLSEDIGDDIEFDPIAICCDYTEYKNWEELKRDYHDIEDMEELISNTTVIDIPGTEGFIIQQY